MTGYFGSKAASGLYQNIIAMMPPHVSGGVDIVQNRRFKDVWIEKRGYLNHQC